MQCLVTTAVLLVALLHCGRTQRSPSADPCQARTGVVAHSDYCDRFLECYQGEVYEVDCPNGLVFSDRHILLDHCVYPHDNLYACLDKELGNEPIATEHCDWLYGIFGHETSCTRYWTCWNGTSIEQFCIGGLLFNEETHSCDWPEFVADCQKHPLCVEDANGNVPLGKSCERYWSCQGGYPRLMRCPATLVFDKISRRCVHPPTDDCDVPPTEAPEELTEARPASNGSRGRRPSRPRPAPPPQQLDVDQDVEYVYDDEEPLDSGFSAPPQRAEVRPAPGRARGQQPISFPRRQSASGGRAPLRGPSIPSGATLVN